FSSRRRHTRFSRDWSSDVCSSDLSQRNGTLYVGVTRDLPKRIHEHRSGITGGFTNKYGVYRLVFAEPHDSAVAAIQREKNIKHRSEERRVGKESRDRVSTSTERKK